MGDAIENNNTCYEDMCNKNTNFVIKLANNNENSLQNNENNIQYELSKKTNRNLR
jgi:hypothetical protein